MNAENFGYGSGGSKSLKNKLEEVGMNVNISADEILCLMRNALSDVELHIISHPTGTTPSLKELHDLRASIDRLSGLLIIIEHEVKCK